MSRGHIIRPSEKMYNDNYSKNLPKGVRATQPFKPKTRTSEAIWRGDTIPFPHPETEAILKGLEQVVYLREWNVPVLKDKLLERHLLRLRENLIWWEDTHPIRHCSSLYIIRQNLIEGPAFAKALDKVITYSYRLMTSSDFTYDSDFLQTEVDENALGFDYFFSPYHLIPFKEKNPETDFYLLQQAPPTVKDSFLEEFKETAREFINTLDYEPRIDSVDQLILATSTSSTYDLNTGHSVNNVTMRHKRAFSKKIDDSLIFKECIVYKAPHETRSCVIPSYETRNKIFLLQKSFKAVADCPEDLYTKSPSYEWLVSKLCEKDDTLYHMSDIKKSGLTFPRPLLLALYEVLKEKNDWAIWDTLLQWDNSTVIKNDLSGCYTMTNGLGLGMFDCAISFSMAVIYNIWKQKYAPEDIHSEGLFWGDDQVIIYKANNAWHDTELQWSVSDTWNSLMKDFGFVIHDKKPFTSTVGCFLETYGEQKTRMFDFRKLNQWIGNLFWPLTSHNIVEAKELMSNLFESFWDDWRPYARPAAQRVIEFWGYEFFPEETDLPVEFGGWFKTKDGPLNMAFVEAEGFTQREAPLLELFNLKRKITGNSKGIKTNEKLIKELKALRSHDYEDSFSLLIKSLQPEGVRPSAWLAQKHWDSLLKKRRACFCNQTFVDPINWVRKHFPDASGNYAVPDVWSEAGFTAHPELEDEFYELTSRNPMRAELLLLGLDKDIDIQYPYPKDYVSLQRDALSQYISDLCWPRMPFLDLYCITKKARVEPHFDNLLSRGRRIKKGLVSFFPKHLLPETEGGVLTEEPITKLLCTVDIDTINSYDINCEERVLAYIFFGKDIGRVNELPYLWFEDAESTLKPEPLIEPSPIKAPAPQEEGPSHLNEEYFRQLARDVMVQGIINHPEEQLQDYLETNSVVSNNQDNGFFDIEEGGEDFFSFLDAG